MKEEIIDTLNRMYGKDKVHEEAAEYFITVFKNVAIGEIRETFEQTSYAVYDDPYFAESVKADLIRDDIVELVETVLETL